MKIGISCYPTYGGSGVVASELALAMAAAGDEVHVISYARPPRLKHADGTVRFHQVEVRHYPLFEYPPYSLALATRIVEVARRHQLDVLHVHYAVPNAVSAVLARQILDPQPLPVVTTLHGTDVTLVGKDPSYLETTRFGVQESDAVTAVSEWLRAVTLDQLAIDRPIEVVPNFLDPDRFSSATCRATSGVELEQPDPELRSHVLVHVSNFRKIKRPLDVLDVFRRLSMRLPCRLILVGEGPERGTLEARARQLGLADRVEVLGNRDAIEKILARADLFLLPSEQESFGLAALEALGCGVPVIGTAVGGLPEVVRHDQWGLLYEVGDTEGMARGAELLLRDPERRRLMGEAGRRWAMEGFSRESAVERYRKIYQQVAAVGIS